MGSKATPKKNSASKQDATRSKSKGKTKTKEVIQQQSTPTEEQSKEQNELILIKPIQAEKLEEDALSKSGIVKLNSEPIENKHYLKDTVLSLQRVSEKQQE